jgi:cobalt-zinc-cadmium efflux system protein
MTCVPSWGSVDALSALVPALRRDHHLSDASGPFPDGAAGRVPEAGVTAADGHAGGHVHGHDHDQGHSHVHGHESGHSHHHHHHHGPADTSDWRYGVGVALNLTFVLIEVGAGFFANSTALLADAGHNLSDVLSLCLAGGAAWLARRPGAARRTYGFGKATILAALSNGLVLVFASGAIALESVLRFGEPATVKPAPVMIVAGIGFVLNLGTALLFMRGREHDVNLRGAFVHMAGDAGVSLAVVVAGLLIMVTGLGWIDPLASLIVVAVVLIGSWGVLKESLDLAMDTAPDSVDVDDVRDFLVALPGVQAVHDMHIWNLSTTETALTAHLVRQDDGDREFLSSTIGDLRRRFGIGHATLQVEVDRQDNCPDC